MHDAIIAAAPAYESHACEHTDHEVLFEDKVGFIRRLDPLQVVAELDVFSRAVLVLRGVQGASISDCALLLEVPRKCVRGAYCRSLHWLYKKADVLRSLGDAGDPGLEILG
jgi:DNA-directed RNA polymerase specialized sigma24 family protein